MTLRGPRLHRGVQAAVGMLPAGGAICLAERAAQGRLSLLSRGSSGTDPDSESAFSLRSKAELRTRLVLDSGAVARSGLAMTLTGASVAKEMPGAARQGGPRPPVGTHARDGLLPRARSPALGPSVRLRASRTSATANQQRTGWSATSRNHRKATDSPISGRDNLQISTAAPHIHRDAASARMLASSYCGFCSPAIPAPRGRDPSASPPGTWHGGEGDRFCGRYGWARGGLTPLSRPTYTPRPNRTSGGETA